MVLINAANHNCYLKMQYTINIVKLLNRYLQFRSFSKTFTIKFPENISGKHLFLKESSI
jgi:hypothetical protein